jgi:tetratricopeptide (TPR) repeat protein
VDLRKGIEYFQQAVEIDSGYARAYVGLAEAYTVLADWGFSPPKEVYPKAMETAQKSLELDPTRAEALTTVAAVEHLHHYNHVRAEETYRRAIELNPNYATAHQWYAEYLMRLGRFDEALFEIDRALELDPLSLIINAVKGSIYYYARRYEDAIRACEATLELDSNFMLALVILMMSYADLEMYDEAFEVTNMQFMVGRADVRIMDSFENAYRKGGYDGVLRWHLDTGFRYTGQPYNEPFFIASAHARLGYGDSAFVWLEKTKEYGSFYILTINIDPVFDPFRSDPRFEKLLKEINLDK